MHCKQRTPGANQLNQTLLINSLNGKTTKNSYNKNVLTIKFYSEILRSRYMVINMESNGMDIEQQQLF